MICNIYNISGNVVSDIQCRAEGERLYISDTTLTRILYMAYDTARLVISCSTKIFKIQVNLAEKIQVKAYANQDYFSIQFTDSSTPMISIVFCS